MLADFTFILTFAIDNRASEIFHSRTINIKNKYVIKTHARRSFCRRLKDISNSGTKPRFGLWESQNIEIVQLELTLFPAVQTIFLPRCFALIISQIYFVSCETMTDKASIPFQITNTSDFWSLYMIIILVIYCVYFDLEYCSMSKKRN